MKFKRTSHQSTYQLSKAGSTSIHKMNCRKIFNTRALKTRPTARGRGRPPLCYLLWWPITANEKN